MRRAPFGGPFSFVGVLLTKGPLTNRIYFNAREIIPRSGPKECSRCCVRVCHGAETKKGRDWAYRRSNYTSNRYRRRLLHYQFCPHRRHTGSFSRNQKSLAECNNCYTLCPKK